MSFCDEFAKQLSVTITAVRLSILVVGGHVHRCGIVEIQNKIVRKHQLIILE